jgi:hypothetical protein
MIYAEFVPSHQVGFYRYLGCGGGVMGFEAQGDVIVVLQGRGKKIPAFHVPL